MPQICDGESTTCRLNNNIVFASTRRKMHFEVATRVPLNQSSLYKHSTQYEKMIVEKIVKVLSTGIEIFL